MDAFNVFLAKGPSVLSELIDTSTGLEVPLSEAQQPSYGNLLLPPGHPVRYHGDDNKTKLCSVIDNNVKETIKPSSRLRVLNSDEEIV